MQRARAPTMLIGGQRATILQQASGSSVPQRAQGVTTTRVVRPLSGQNQQPGLPQTPVRMVGKLKETIFHQTPYDFNVIGPAHIFSVTLFTIFIEQVMQSPGNLQPSIAPQSQQTGQQQSGQSGTNQQGQVRRSLTLTKDQMMEAQEMFRTANKVTRPEKALILGFMAGSRENPCPHLGKELDLLVLIPRF